MSSVKRKPPTPSNLIELPGGAMVVICGDEPIYGGPLPRIMASTKRGFRQIRVKSYREAVEVMRKYRPVCIDAEACAAWDEGVVSSGRNQSGTSVTAKFDDFDAAVDFAAEVNGFSREEVLRNIRMLSEYLYNLRTGRASKERPVKKAAKRKPRPSPPRSR